jgi:hypothetical protein
VLQRLRSLLRGDWAASVLTGVFFTLVLLRIEEPHGRFEVALVGAVYALCVHGLMGLFGVRRWGWAVAGFLAGPVPLAILSTPKPEEAGERAGILLLAALFGLLIGLVRWAREARRSDRAAGENELDDRPH